MCSRYDNERKLIYAYLTEWFSMSGFSNESVCDLRHLLDRTRDLISCLANLGCPTEQWDLILMFLTVQRVNPQTRREWEKRQNRGFNDEQKLDDGRSEVESASPFNATWNNLEDFLEEKIKELEMIQPVKIPDPTANAPKVPKRSTNVNVSATTSDPTPTEPGRSCSFCEEEHKNYNCPVLRSNSPEERNLEVKRLQLCYNCLGTHYVLKCQSKSAVDSAMGSTTLFYTRRTRRNLPKELCH